MKEFEIKYSGLSEGIHHFDFSFDKKILNDDFEALDVKDIKGHLKLEMEKKVNLLTFKLHYDYEVECPCSRCDELMWTPLTLDEVLYVRLTDETYEGEDENIEHHGTTEHTYSIFKRMTEDLKLGIPMIISHDEEACSFEDLIEEMEEGSEEEEVDERWNALKELKNKLDKE